MSLVRRYFPSFNIKDNIIQDFEGKEVDRILWVENSVLFGGLIFYVIFKNDDDDKPFRISYAADFNLAFPAEVIKYYEKRINWSEDPDSEEDQERKAIEALEQRLIKEYKIELLDKNGETSEHTGVHIEIGQVDDDEEINKSQGNEEIKTGDYGSQMDTDTLSISSVEAETETTEETLLAHEQDDIEDFSKKTSLPTPPPRTSILIPFQQEKRKKRTYIKKKDRESLQLDGNEKTTKNSLKSNLNKVYSTFNIENINHPSASTSSVSRLMNPFRTLLENPFRKINRFPNLIKDLNDLQKNTSSSSSLPQSPAPPKTLSLSDTDTDDNDKNSNSTENSSKFTKFDLDNMLIYDGDGDSSDDDYSKSKRKNFWN